MIRGRKRLFHDFYEVIEKAEIIYDRRIKKIENIEIDARVI